MKISTKGRYGLRVMVELALNYSNSEYISSKELAEKQGLSVKYLETIIGVLNKAKLIKTQRGSLGGHKLSKSPESYKVGDILTVLEGSLCPVDCTNCEKQETCYTKGLWKKLQGAIDEVLYNTTLEDLKSDALNNESSEYNI